MIGIGGLARSGKDTMAKCLSEIISEELNVDVKIFSFADKIKSQMKDFIQDVYEIDVFTENTEEKDIIRDLLVTHGETMKKLHGKTIWAEIVIDEIKQGSKNVFPIIPDVRFDFEADKVKSEDGQIIHIALVGNNPPNNIEAENDPLVQKNADISHTWPVYEPNKMDECMSHAELLWQMLAETHGEKWKKIYA